MASAEATKPSQGAGINLVKLEAGYSAYCKALKMLIQEGKSLKEIQRTLCWQRLEMLHHSLPRQYRDPVMHYGMVKRSLEAEKAQRNA
jgi:hypothetical protein